MTLERPMFPPRATVPARHSYPAPVVLDPAAAAPPAKPAKIGRRGLLGAFLALVPTAAAAGAAAALPAAAAPPVPRESRRLIRLGEQLDQAEAAFTAALARRAKSREKAEFALPEPPTEIVFLPGEHPPAWCGVIEETDVVGKVVYWRGNPNFRSTARKIACPARLEDFLRHADGRTREAREARRMLVLARQHDEATERAIEESGYRAAADEVFKLAQRIGRIAGMIYRCECRTFEGLAIKALALLVATKADNVEDYIAHRSKVVLYAEQLAAGVLNLRRAAPSKHWALKGHFPRQAAAPQS